MTGIDGVMPFFCRFRYLSSISEVTKHREESESQAESEKFLATEDPAVCPDLAAPPVAGNEAEK